MDEKIACLEALARMAARFAGRDPDEHLRMVLGDVLVFDGALWRYPQFLRRAEEAYLVLANLTLAPSTLNGFPGGSGLRVLRHATQSDS